MCPHRLRPRSLWLLVALAAIVWAGVPDVHAGKPLYAYVDDRGNRVATDQLENIPLRYRDRVKVIQDAGGSSAWKTTVSEASASLARAPEGALFTLVARMPARVVPGLSTYQSVILIGGFLAMILFYGAGKLTKGPFWRAMMPWAIGILAVLMVHFMFISDVSNQVATRYPGKSTGSLIKKFQHKSQDISTQNQRRLKDFDQRTGSDS